MPSTPEAKISMPSSSSPPSPDFKSLVQEAIDQRDETIATLCSIFNNTILTLRMDLKEARKQVKELEQELEDKNKQIKALEQKPEDKNPPTVEPKSDYE